MIKNSPLLYEKILDRSKSVDEKFQTLTTHFEGYEIVYPVAPWHTRYDDVSRYSLKIEQLTTIKKYLGKGIIIWLIDMNVASLPFVKNEIIDDEKNKVYYVTPHEHETKEYLFLSNFIQENGLDKLNVESVVAVGGGIICNQAAFLAESLRANLFLVTTTVMSMADVCGGKVRANLVNYGGHVKHYYKSFYEPNLILGDLRFLDHLPERFIGSGLAEFIKQGIFQSPSLLAFLLSNEFQPFDDKTSLVKAVLWAADLKRVCIELDPEEKPDGSRIILRGGHDISDRIEEQLEFQIPHGFAVGIGIMRQLEKENDPHLDDARRAFKRFGIPTSINEWKEMQKTSSVPKASRQKEKI